MPPRPTVMVQGRFESGSADPAKVHSLAEQGFRGPSSTLPYHDQIQASFGSHDISSVQAYTSSSARSANEQMGARAYASGSRVAFKSAPDLHTAAHEAAHVVQQRAGLSLPGGVGSAGDRHEQLADSVATEVVQGRSASPMLDQYEQAPASGASVQLVQKEDDKSKGGNPDAKAPPSSDSTGRDTQWEDSTTKWMQTVQTFLESTQKIARLAKMMIGFQAATFKQKAQSSTQNVLFAINEFSQAETDHMIAEFYKNYAQEPNWAKMGLDAVMVGAGAIPVVGPVFSAAYTAGTWIYDASNMHDHNMKLLEEVSTKRSQNLKLSALSNKAQSDLVQMVIGQSCEEMFSAGSYSALIEYIGVNEAFKWNEKLNQDMTLIQTIKGRDTGPTEVERTLLKRDGDEAICVRNDVLELRQRWEALSQKMLAVPDNFEREGLKGLEQIKVEYLKYIADQGWPMGGITLSGMLMPMASTFPKPGVRQNQLVLSASVDKVGKTSPGSLSAQTSTAMRSRNWQQLSAAGFPMFLNLRVKAPHIQKQIDEIEGSFLGDKRKIPQLREQEEITLASMTPGARGLMGNPQILGTLTNASGEQFGYINLFPFIASQKAIVANALWTFIENTALINFAGWTGMQIHQLQV